MTNAVNLASAAGTGFAFRNRIINGDMRIDQRNGGNAASVSGYGYTLDRWGFSWAATGGVASVQRSTVAPTDFTNSIGITVTTPRTAISTDAFQLFHKVEALNTADFNMGTANAKTITLSFWVRSSITGTYGLGFTNNSFNRSYVTTYTINAANTWEYKSVTLQCDTTGTWTTDNTIGINLAFDLGSGTNFNGTNNAWNAGNLFRTSSCVNWIANSGATFYLTGVQLEVGSVATPFERRPYSLELALAQYYYVGFREYAFTVGYDASYTSYNSGGVTWSYQMRATPSISVSAGSMMGHHAFQPVVMQGPYNGGVILAFNGSGLRANSNCGATVTFSLNAEL